MRVLIIKMSSMGDIIHALPALTDAKQANPVIKFDWVIEENFQEIPHWHPAVDQVIPIALRRWKKNIFSIITYKEILKLIKRIREIKYDLIIDAQGLLKSAFISLIAKGKRAGSNYMSIREPLAALFYHHKYDSGKIKQAHAVTRIRQLFSKVFNYKIINDIPDYGIKNISQSQTFESNYLVFLHGTTWDTKHWPEMYWLELAKIAAAKGYSIKLPWGNIAEKNRAMRIASNCEAVEVLPKLSLKEIATVLASAKAIVAVDTGLGHLAAALNVPTVSLYGPTNPTLTGAMGISQKWLNVNFPCSPCLNRECLYPNAGKSSVQPPCFTTISPIKVWSELALLALYSPL